MKIAHILPHSVTYPLVVHNARHTWALELAQLQALSGHEVTIYCNPASRINAVASRGINTSTGNIKDNNLRTFQLALSQDHDIYHSHFDNLHYEVATDTRRPIVFTQHWWPGESTLELANTYGGVNVWAVPPTKYMQAYDIAHNIQTNGVIYHGIDLSLFKPTGEHKNGRLLSVGRVSPEKNLETSIRIAKQSNMGMDIIGKVADKNQEYWKTLLKDIDGTHIRYLGPKPRDELAHYYSVAQAVLFPSDINEPFGLVAIESQACGTPIIMARGGSRAELLQEGVTGYLCANDADYVAAARQSSNINSNSCKAFASIFDIHSMAANYETLYRKLLD